MLRIRVLMVTRDPSMITFKWLLQASPTDENQAFSTAPMVPAVFSTAILSALTTVASFNQTQQQLVRLDCSC